MSVEPTSLAVVSLLQLPAPFTTTLGEAFLGAVALLVVLFVARIVLRIAWKVALVASIGLGAFLLVTTVMV